EVSPHLVMIDPRFQPQYADLNCSRAWLVHDPQIVGCAGDEVAVGLKTCTDGGDPRDANLAAIDFGHDGLAAPKRRSDGTELGAGSDVEDPDVRCQRRVQGFTQAGSLEDRIVRFHAED